jgi:hypothetical protein
VFVDLVSNFVSDIYEKINCVPWHLLTDKRGLVSASFILFSSLGECVIERDLCDEVRYTLVTSYAAINI